MRITLAFQILKKKMQKGAARPRIMHVICRVCGDEFLLGFYGEAFSLKFSNFTV